MAVVEARGAWEAQVARRTKTVAMDPSTFPMFREELRGRALATGVRVGRSRVFPNLVFTRQEVADPEAAEEAWGLLRRIRLLA